MLVLEQNDIRNWIVTDGRRIEILLKESRRTLNRNVANSRLDKRILRLESDTPDKSEVTKLIRERNLGDLDEMIDETR